MIESVNDTLRRYNYQLGQKRLAPIPNRSHRRQQTASRWAIN